MYYICNQINNNIMTNEETLELLKPIMLDGGEKVGDVVYHLIDGYVEIQNPISKSIKYPINVNGTTYTYFGYRYDLDSFPTLFKCNPFEWLASRTNNQERVIEVLDGSIWKKRVLIAIKNGFAICWGIAENIEQSKNIASVSFYDKWREVPIQKTITKEQALQMLAENGVDTTNLIIE